LTIIKLRRSLLTQSNPRDVNVPAVCALDFWVTNKFDAGVTISLETRRNYLDWKICDGNNLKEIKIVFEIISDSYTIS